MQRGYEIVPAQAAHVAEIAAIELAAAALFSETDLPVRLLFHMHGLGIGLNGGLH